MTLEANDFARLTLETAAGGHSAADLAAAATARMNRFEPAVNAVIARHPGAAERAAGLDAAGGALPLRGAPLAIADNIMVRGVAATCAGTMLVNFVPPRDATVIEKLTAAGAVVTAKTNMDEFGMGSTGETSAAGPAKNPWNPARTAGGGGAGGAAAIVAYGGAAGALAVDTSGAVRSAAAFCGLIGMKPTYGRVSRNGAAALGSSMDQIGPITRTARDNALVLDVITGADPLDSTSRVGPAGSALATIDDGVKGLLLAWSPALLDRPGVTSDVAEAYRKAVELCRDGGADVREVALPLVDEGAAAAAIIICCEASANMTRLDGMRYGVLKDGADNWEVYSRSRGEGFGDEVKRRVMLGAWALSKNQYEDVFLRATRVRRRVADGLNKVLSGVDAVILPVAPCLPAKLGGGGTGPDAFRADIFTVPASLAGLPAISYPVGLAGGLPTAAQAMALPFREDVLYRIARAAETAAPFSGAPWTKAMPEGAE